MTYTERARATPRRIRIRRLRVTGLLVVIAAIAAALDSQLLASASSTATSFTDVPRTEHRGPHSGHRGAPDAPGERNALGQADGLCQIYVNEPWHYELHPEAIDHGCPAMYADPAHGPRMQR